MDHASVQTSRLVNANVRGSMQQRPQAVWIPCVSDRIANRSTRQSCGSIWIPEIAACFSMFSDGIPWKSAGNRGVLMNSPGLLYGFSRETYNTCENLVSTRGNPINTRGNLVSTRENPINTRGNLVSTRGNLVNTRGNPTDFQRNPADALAIRTDFLRFRQEIAPFRRTKKKIRREISGQDQVARLNASGTGRLNEGSQGELLQSPFN